ncbi:MAG: fdhA 2 [Rhodospirillales bacterium]|jgi:threonine dehydrogenase-like Zn-dependent dehydrogenase|nr:fdhA 2 [Rhodospirillales bacterium]
MRAACWHGKEDIRVDTVPDPAILDGRDAIVRITSTCICGSDLHLYDGYVPTMESGDILGHEFMGEVVEVGRDNKKLKVGDRVIVPFTICCGECFYCKKGLWSVCERSNRNAGLARKMFGQTTAGLFGYSHLTGGYAGGQAQFARVPYADVAPIKIPDGLADEQVVFLTDIFPTGYFGADIAGIEPGDTVAVWGCGPVAQFAIRSAFMLGAGRVVAIDEVPERLKMAREGGAETIDFAQEDVYDRLQSVTNGRGPDRCIDAVGAEAAGHGGLDAVADRAKAFVGLTTDRAHVLRQAIMNCRPGGTVSIIGVYVGFPDKIPFGAAMNKGLTFRMGQAHVPAYHEKLLAKIQNGEIDPSFVITHVRPLESAPEMYRTFRDKKDGCIKVVLKP